MTTTTRFKPIKTVFQMSADGSVNPITLILTHGRKGYIVVRKSGTVETCRTLPIADLPAAQAEFDKQTVELSVIAAEAGFPVEYVQKKTGRMIPCPGEAHQNPIGYDHCMVCLPRWGEIEELAPIDLAAARAARQDIPVGWTSP